MRDVLGTREGGGQHDRTVEVNRNEEEEKGPVDTPLLIVTLEGNSRN